VKTCKRCRRFDCPGHADETLEHRIVRYLHKHVALSTAQMYAWSQSVTRNGGYTLADFDACLYYLRDSGRIAVANGEWYLRFPNAS